MMSWQILHATGRLRKHEPQISEALHEAIGLLSRYFDIDLDICVADSREHSNPILGIGGGALSSSLLVIFLDPDHAGIRETIAQDLLAVLAHEVHHCVRMASVKDKTLADRLVTEGLACHFETEITGRDLPSFLPAETAKAWERYFAVMQPKLNDCEFREDALFLGASPTTLPRYAGYAVGFGLVKAYLSCGHRSAAGSAAVSTADVMSAFKR
ncbi:MAG: hypothetical protein CME38_15495 [Haliea sp.]|nr:hypothetical protein [Haliea sp.]|tara:strand:+ start:1123 stop:1761 length:639 start_codon:yes stop_codon:yes gene_type:complete